MKLTSDIVTAWLLLTLKFDLTRIMQRSTIAEEALTHADCGEYCWPCILMFENMSSFSSILDSIKYFNRLIKEFKNVRILQSVEQDVYQTLLLQSTRVWDVLVSPSVHSFDSLQYQSKYHLHHLHHSVVRVFCQSHHHCLRALNYWVTECPWVKQWYI